MTMFLPDKRRGFRNQVSYGRLAQWTNCLTSAPAKFKSFTKEVVMRVERMLLRFGPARPTLLTTNYSSALNVFPKSSPNLK